MPFHAILSLSGGRQKTIPNRSEERMLSEVVIPFVNSGVVTSTWGSKRQSYQVLELRIYQTDAAWDKKAGALQPLIARKRNLYSRFETKAQDLLGKNKPRVFVVTPIQGDKYGGQEDQRIHREFDERFEVIERVVALKGGVAIRIDKEHTLDELVARIKAEIRRSAFIVADLTDERPSCYFEVGFAEALGKPVIYMSSHNSVLSPGQPTKIHFDIHRNVQFFVNHTELAEKLTAVIDKNRAKLFEGEAGAGEALVIK